MSTTSTMVRLMVPLSFLKQGGEEGELVVQQSCVLKPPNQDTIINHAALRWPSQRVFRTDIEEDEDVYNHEFKYKWLNSKELE